MKYTDKDRKAVINTILGESANQPYEGMLGVAEVIRNRAMQKGRSPFDVVMQPKQFSFNNNPILASKFLQSDKVTPDSLQLAYKAFNDAFENGTNTVGGSTHYHTDKVNPNWSAGKKPVIIIGRHKFYKDIAW